MKSIEKAYAFINDVDPAVPAISQELIASDSETIWQQIAYGNKKFQRYFAKQKVVGIFTFLFVFLKI